MKSLFSSLWASNLSKQHSTAAFVKTDLGFKSKRKVNDYQHNSFHGDSFDGQHTYLEGTFTMIAKYFLLCILLKKNQVIREYLTSREIPGKEHVF